MELLNLDCWYNVLGFMELKHQIRLYRSHAGLGKLVAGYWRYKAKCVEINFVGNDIDIEEFDIFVANTCKTLEVLKLKCISPDMFNALVKYKYPKTRDFRFSQLNNSLFDEDILRISEAFPNLKTFSPHGLFSGDDMWKFRKLEHLTLTHCKIVNVHCVADTFRRTPIKSSNFDCISGLFPLPNQLITYFHKLERIFMNMYEWNWFLFETQKAKLHQNEFEQNLKELSLTCTDITMVSVVRQLGQFFPEKKIIGVHLGQLPLLYEYYSNLPHLRCMTMTMCPTTASIDALQLVEFCKELSELHFYSCQIPLESHITDLLVASTRLDRISFEDCTMPFGVLNINAPAIIRDRTKLLTFNFYGNFVDENTVVNLAVSGESQLFRVTHKKTLNRCEHALQFKLE